MYQIFFGICPEFTILKFDTPNRFWHDTEINSYEEAWLNGLTCGLKEKAGRGLREYP